MRDAVDVCIVGCGAAGSVLAKELAERKLAVVVLDAGPWVRREDIPTPRFDWELHLTDFYPSDERRDRITLAPGSDRFSIARFKGVGGSTMRWEGFSTRMHPGDLRRKTLCGVGADWPLEYADLEPHYDHVGTILGVAGTRDSKFDPPRGPHPNPPIEFSCAVQRVKAGCDELGLHTAHAPMAILTRPTETRMPCNYCGGCWWGCFMGALSNMGQTYVPLAQTAGAEIRARCTVARIVMEQSGKKARGVEYFDEAGNLDMQPARAIAVCGNGVETPRLLLLSATPDHPDRLANSSGLLGRYFSGDTLVKAYGLVEERVDGYRSPNIGGMVQDFYDHDDSRSFLGGYLIALRNGEGGPLQCHQRWVRHKGLFGAALIRAMNATFGHSLNISAYGETLPQEGNQVSLDKEVTDTFGLPVPRIRTVLGGNEKRMQAHMGRALHSILDAAGADEIGVEAYDSIMGTHLLGTCRMGTDPKTSVTDPFGRTHDVTNLFIADGSLFPCGTPANPTLTILALATRVALGMVGRFQRGEL
jgi:choline dehydrogenase-like flavoprotein